MAKFISQSRYVETTFYFLDFQRVEGGGGFCFPCDKDGKIEVLNPDGQKNYDDCISGKVKVIRVGVRPYHNRYREPAVIECNHCRCHVVLDDFMTNRCKCGTFYNGSGQELAPPSQWGEETGERFDDNGNQIL